MALTPAALLAFVSTAIMARMGGDPPKVIEVPPEPKPEPKPVEFPEVDEPGPNEPKEEPEPEEDDEKTALKRDLAALREYQKMLLQTLARERDERIELLGRLAAAELSRDAWATLYTGNQVEQLVYRVTPEPGLQAQLRAQSMLGTPIGMLGSQAPHRVHDASHRHWGICTCVPGRADAFRHRIGE